MTEQSKTYCAYGQFSEDLRRIGNDLCQMLRNLGPSDAANSHFRQSRVEFLKGIRQIIDDRIERVSRGPAPGTTGTQGAHVPVD
ncbi:MAG TPA: hypothetical protein VE621_13070 [Bryobacteraceae bacterium]|nr:hypothetical protein [Bryobacteraceae bacterium]